MAFEGKTVKPLKLINYNNKKHNQVMIEVNVAPDGPLSENKLASTVFFVTWDDGETGYYELVDLWRVAYKDLTNSDTIASHAMYCQSFQKWFANQKKDITGTTEMGIYIYMKLPAPE